MKVIGIDPGINKLGYGVIEEGLKIVECGLISPPKEFYEKKIEYLVRNVLVLINKYNPDFISIEEIYVAKNVRVALKIGILIGGIIGISILENRKFLLIPPREIKKSITGKGGATKEQVRFMVENLTNFYNFRNFEETDAVACAISAIFKIKEKENVVFYKR